MNPFLLIRRDLLDGPEEVAALGGILTLEPFKDQRPDLIEDLRILSVVDDSPVQFTEVTKEIDEVCLLKVSEDAVRVPL